VLFPGVAVGAGAVVLSGSSVVTAVPPGRLFGGVPAQDLKAAAQPLTRLEVGLRAADLVREFARQLALRGLPVRCDERGGGLVVTVQHGGDEHRLVYTAVLAPAVPGGREQVLVGLADPDGCFAAAPPGATAICLDPPRVAGPLGPLGAAFREFLRKRGVRLHPRTWAYTGGWL
jgi:hypothetical protein